MAICIFLLSCLLTAALRNYAIKKSIIDIPNSRSSHTIPTPRGGGVAIVLSFAASLFLLSFTGYLKLSFLYALMGGLGVAILGFMDDRGHIPSGWRLLGHLIAGIWFLFWIGGIPPILIFGFSLDLGWYGNILALVYLVWMLNLYNFMDGIDGIASIEAISTCICGACLYFIVGHNEAVALPLLLAVSVAGFLCWNYPPAKIFMGDAGSGFLGFILAAFTLEALWAQPQLLWSWIILLGVFVVDATATLLCRFMRGKRVYEAHRSHAYQHASRFYGAHKPISITVFFINLLWLFPWSIAVALSKLDGLVALLIAYTPLVYLAIKFNAGKDEELR